MPAPTHAELVAFAFGKLSPSQVEDVAARLEQFPAALAELHTIAGTSDSLLETIRQAVPAARYAGEPELQRAMQQVTGMVSGDETIDIASRHDATLAPAEKPIAVATAPQQLRDYRLQEKLGEGGMGAVYKAVHERLGKTVALKILPAERMKDPQVVARFHREMKAVGRLDHPNIIRATDAGDEAGMHYLVMEFVEGDDVSKVVDRHGPLGVADACEIIRQASVGLQHAHEHGLVHRDIKPANMLLTRQGVVKLLDLGLARLHEEGPVAAGGELTSDGQLMGTVDYIAPEQAADTRTADIRADIYSLGCSLFKLLTGKPPFTGEGFQTPVQKIMAHTMTPPPSLAKLRTDVPPALLPIIDRMLAKNRNDRYPTPGELAAAIAPFCANADLQRAAIGDKPSAVSTQPAASSPDVTTVDQRTHPSSFILHPFLRLALAASLPFIAFGIWLIVRDKDGNEVARVKLPEKATFGVEDDDNKTPPDPAQSATKPDAATLQAAAKEREVAEWFSSHGAYLYVNMLADNRYVQFSDASNMPAEPFLITRLDLPKDNPIAPDDLWRINRLTKIKELWCELPWFQDEHLATIELPQLSILYLGKSSITDAGIDSLARFRSLESMHIDFARGLSIERLAQRAASWPRLVNLSCGGEGFSDADLEYLAAFSDRLKSLWIHGRDVTEVGIKNLAPFQKLDFLALFDTRPGVLQGLPPLPNLRELLVYDRPLTVEEAETVRTFRLQHLLFSGRINSPVLEALAESPHLGQLYLRLNNATLATPDTWQSLKKFRELNRLTLTMQEGAANLTADNVRELAAALPTTTIQSSFGVIEPTKTADVAMLQATAKEREVAEWCASHGIRFDVSMLADNRIVSVPNASNLPAQPYFVCRLYLPEDEPVAPHDLRRINDLSRIQMLHCGRTWFKDEHLAVLDLPKLPELVLSNSAITDAAVDSLARFHQLDSLNIWCDGVSLERMAQNARDWPKLRHLAIGHNNTTDSDLSHLPEFAAQLKTLELRAPDASEVGLKNLLGLPNLVAFYLTGCRPGALSSLAGHPKLEFLHYSQNKLLVREAEAIRALPKLRDLTICSNSINEPFLVALATVYCQEKFSLKLHYSTLLAPNTWQTLKNFRGLGHLGLDNTTNLTAENVRELAAALPTTRITSDFGTFEPTETPATDPDRRAAEWVLSIDGLIHIAEDGKQREAAHVDDLPGGTFELRGIVLTGNVKVSDAGLAHCKDCKNLKFLYLQGTKVSDAGLAHFKDCRNIDSLQLSGTKVGDAGLANFKECKNLYDLNLGVTQVSDAGLSHLRECKNLGTLILTGTQVSDAGLAYFKDCPNLAVLQLANCHVSDVGLGHLNCENLTQLVLSGTRVSDAGLTHFKNCKNLGMLYLASTRVSDAGLAQFKECKNLMTLILADTQVSDAGLAHFQDCKNLADLRLNNTQVSDAGLERIAGDPNLAYLEVVKTKVTEAGVKKLSAALPGCKIEWDGGVIEPTPSTNPDRRAAEWVLSIGGGISITENGQERPIAAVADLPKGPFELTVVNLISNAKVSDAGLANFKDCKNLTSLDLAATQVSDAGLAHFKDCKNLERLVLRHVPVSATGLVHFKDCKNLTHLDLDDTKVSDAGLAHFADCKNLTHLSLNTTLVRDAWLVHFKDCKDLTHLGLGNAGYVGDAGLAHFKDCKNLTGLVLHNTQVSDAGLLHFKDCKNLTSLVLGATQASDAGLAHFKDCKNLTSLDLAATKVSDAGLVHFKDCKNLERLNLASTQVSDAGLAYFKDRKNLTLLGLDRTKVSDAGLAHFADCKNLFDLRLRETQLTDAGLDYFKDCKNLPILVLSGTKVTEAGVRKLSAALPKCKIEWDGGVLEPTQSTDPDRLAAEWVLSIGGSILIKENGQGRWTGANGDLPRGAFELAVVRLPGNQQVSDEGLANFKDCLNLTDLDLNHTAVSDAGLAHFKDCKNLTILELHGTRLSDAGLANFKDCHDISILGLNQTALTDAGLAHFKDCQNLTVLDVSGTEVSDAGLAHFKHCKNLTGLTLSGTQVSDAGLAHFQDCQNLVGLALSQTAVTDAGLGHFQDCQNLKALNLAHTQVSDAGLAHFKHCQNLTYLNLADTQASDAGLVHFQDCQNLTDIHLNGTRLTDVGLAYFKNCENLWALTLFSTRVSDTGLAHFKDHKNLAILRLNATQVSDAGLADLAGCPKLAELSVTSTKVTEAGVKKLAGGLPGCKIEWDGGVIEATQATNPDRRAAEWVRSVGGAVEISEEGKQRKVAAVADLPQTGFELTVVDVRGPKVTDEALECFKGCRNLTYLIVQGNFVTDAGLANFQDCHDLTYLNLDGTELTDAGLEHFKECKNLTGLALPYTQVSDAAVDRLASFTKLRSLNLQNTKFTEAGLRKLEAALPNCKIEWDGKMDK